MNYNRYLDLHLCTSSDMAACKQKAAQEKLPKECFFSKDTHFYEFSADIMKQMRYREGKNEGFTSGDKGNCKILDEEELTRDTAGFLRFTGGEITDELKQLRYISCMVSIENLKKKTVYPNLSALVRWLSDPQTVNKLRVNCHGAGTAEGGFSMGKATMSPKEFVDALVRHGLTRPDTHAAAVLVHGFRWKHDSEKAACEGCGKEFTFVRRKHHCRRCGGLFCDACSSRKLDLAVALTGENNATAKNVKKARVCNPCYNEGQGAVVGDVIARERARLAVQAGTAETKYGLQQITLGLCMGARTDSEFSPERDPNLAVDQQAAGTFVRDSLANRVLVALRGHNLRGIRLAASNQVVAGNDKGIRNVCGVVFPTDVSGAGQTAVDEKKKFFGSNKSTFDFPAYIFGSRKQLKDTWNAIQARRTRSGSQTTDGYRISVSPNGRSLFFGLWKSKNDAQYNEVYRDFFLSWKFRSWQVAKHDIPPLAGAAPTESTLLITAPPRVTQITFIKKPSDNSISVTGRAEDLFKQYKSYEVS